MLKNTNLCYSAQYGKQIINLGSVIEICFVHGRGEGKSVGFHVWAILYYYGLIYLL